MKFRIMLGMITLCICATAQPKYPNNKNFRGGIAARQTTLTCNNWLFNNASNSYVKVGDLDISGTSLTVEALFNRTSVGPFSPLSEGHIISKSSVSQGVNYELFSSSAIITTTDGTFLTPAVCTPAFNKTYHVAMVYNGVTLKFYRNGFLLSQIPASGNLLVNNTDATIAASDPGSFAEYFFGYINEVRVWNTVRSQDDIRTYMNGSLPNPTTQTGLLAYYTFDNLVNKQGNSAFNGISVGGASFNAANPACTFVPDSCAVNVVIPGFTTPDSVCVNQTVDIHNTTIGGTNYFWNFCRPDLNQPPQAVNIGNVGGILSQPSFMDYVFENGNYYGLSNNYFPGKLVRLDFGASLLNVPTVTDLGNFGGIIPPGPGAEGIQIIKNEGKWYAIIVGGSPVGGTTPRIIKIEFGTAITNPAPVATNWGNIGILAQPIDLIMFQQNSVWYGLTVNSENNTVTRFNFTSSFDNVPTGVNFGNIGGLSYPTGIHALSDNGTWRVFVTNGGNSTDGANSSITRLDFGNSLLNPPTGVNLGNPGGVFHQPRDITVIQTCGQIFGYIVNGVTNDIIKLNFNNNLLSVPVSTSLGNIGGLSFPCSISKLFRSGSDLYAFITNINNNTITRLRFAGCSNSNIANSNLQNPPAFTYTSPGIYNIDLLVDEGLATQGTACRQITVLPLPTVSTRTDTTLCLGSSVPLTTTGSNATSYSWAPATGLSNSGIASPIATPTATTTYIVTAKNAYCQKQDTVTINVNTNCNSTTALTCNNWLSTPTQPSFVNIGNLNITGNKISIEAVINRTSFLSNGVSTEGDIVSKHSGPPDVNYILRPTRGLITTTNGFYYTPDVCPLQLNKTYHIAMVYDGTTLKYYRNGFLMSQVAASGNLIQNNWNTYIAYFAPQTLPENFVGYINEVRIWNVARTQSEIRTYMNGSLPNPTTQTGLLAYYTFDNLLNKQGNPAWNGTLNGGASINATNPNCTFVADSCAIQQSGISSIINDYTPVINLLSCENKITVEDGAAFNVGDTVLIIQMKGATIDTTNTSNFGTVTNYGNAGNYEFNYVKSRIGNVVELKNNLTRQYTIPSGKVQLIRVPYYLSTNVSATLTCLPWDGSKGGVLAFNVRDTLTLNADVDVSGRGFRGGSGIHDITNTENCNQNQFFYPADPYQASEKGEGIATLSSGKVYGKGKNANGGGGGNSHNSGGAGGANAANGGFGGYQYELGGCSGTAPFDNRGIGGQGLTYNNATNKVFLGGGAGSGQANNPALFYPKGGNGAGIAFITANYLQGNNKNIILQGENATACTSINGTDCHEGMGGGGGGGTLLFNVNQVIGTFNCNTAGGKGGNMTVGGNGRLGPGGGGSGGVIWAKQVSVPGVTINQAGGANGVATSFGNDPWGATAGQNGITLFNLKIPVDTLSFQKNIDSLRIKDSLTNCNTFDFKGFSFVHVAPIISWQWTFGDGGAAATQNTVHQYPSTTGNYLVKLVVTDANGCKDSISKMVNIPGANTADFSFQLDPCTPLSIQFISNAPVPLNNYWSFGDGGSVQNNQSPAHLFAAPGNYTIRYTNPSGNCVDTITKIITVGTTYQNIILTGDTTICYATSKQLLTMPSNLFCWSPATYLNNPLLANPTTSTPQNIIYYFTSQVTGNNLIANGNFSQGNSGFTSAYTFTPANSGSGQYNVATSAGAWLGTSVACNTDHTSGTGNMLMANGSTTTGAPVWSQTVAVVPNTNYELSGWLAGLNTLNPATIHFAVNGIRLGTPLVAAGTTCQWNRFSTIWNSGLQTSINLSIIDTNSQASGNDFALDDLAFAPIFIRRDSVIINVDTPFVRAGNDTAICLKDTVRLQANGAVTYSWTPTGSLSNTGVNNPLAFPALNTQYIVSGTNINGCIAKDTVNVSVKPLPVITALTNDTTICRNASVQLNAGGGTSYTWQPANSLSNPFIANPVATPVNTVVTYSVTVTGTNGCNAKDSVIVTTKPLPLFKVDPLANTCSGNEVQLHAYGGNSYQWVPTVGLSASNISNPFASPASGTNYSVIIRDSICNESTQLNVVVNVLPLPVLTVSKSNDIDCTNGLAKLTVTGANTYRWAPGNSLSDSTIASPAATPSVTTLYTVTGRSFNGCENKDTLSVFVKFDGNGMHYLPTAFTPNGDGLNECFGVKSWGQVTDLNFTIYNRWGERVFYTTNPNICWDGRYKNQLQQAGNFIYIIQAKTPCGAIDMKGSLLLIR